MIRVFTFMLLWLLCLLVSLVVLFFIGLVWCLLVVICLFSGCFVRSVAL